MLAHNEADCAILITLHLADPIVIAQYPSCRYGKQSHAAIPADGKRSHAAIPADGQNCVIQPHASITDMFAHKKQTQTN